MVVRGIKKKKKGNEKEKLTIFPLALIFLCFYVIFFCNPPLSPAFFPLFLLISLVVLSFSTLPFLPSILKSSYHPPLLYTLTSFLSLSFSFQHCTNTGWRGKGDLFSPPTSRPFSLLVSPIYIT